MHRYRELVQKCDGAVPINPAVLVGSIGYTTTVDPMVNFVKDSEI